ncbi:5-oxoprolinase subunit PxpB [Evansella clarkii]|uniref:5-oxoprolinase subunit PxpB n=1 Tax=Evansella clarkii TaxID=79879 RepID=UPI00099652B6|nr:5-oxoprolinase subunit PxpB [Evansella clarkii]
MEKQRFSPMGDSAVRVSFGEGISKEINNRIRGFAELLRKAGIKGIREWTPSYTAVTVYYDPCEKKYSEITAELEELYRKLEETELPPAKRVIVPVCYEGEFAPDLEDVANHNGLSTDEVVSIHKGGDYLIYMLGFTPGFPYMGGMAPKIATPRLEVPRSHVPAGSVGIAGEQTGIYSLDTPGGWRIIGRTPLVLYDSKRENPSLFEAGDHVSFRAISTEEYEDIKKQVEAGEYEVEYETVD